MRRADAFIGSVVAGCLSIGLLLGDAQATFAQQTMAPEGADAPLSVSGDAHTASEGGSALIERLNKALENALTGPDGKGPLSGMALAIRGAEPDRGPVVIEMFTSQGCASCPPADETFLQYAERPDVIALALHVDYWDYLGWEDPFAQPAFTARQKAYARAARSRSIYTPQMIVEGDQSLVGADTDGLDALIEQEKNRPAQVALKVSGSDGRYTIDLSAPKAPLDAPAVVQIVRYAPHARAEILRGENAGMVVDYANVVTGWHAVADWDGQTATRLNAHIEGDQPAVVVVQSVIPGKGGTLPGPVLAAARLN